MAKKKENESGDKGGTNYHFGETHVGPGAVFGPDMSKNKTIAGRDATATSTGSEGEASGMMGIAIGLVLMAVGIILAVAVPTTNLPVRFVFVFVVAMGAAMLANGLIGKMKYSKGPVTAYGPYAVFVFVAGAGGVLLYLDRPAATVPAKPAPPAATNSM